MYKEWMNVGARWWNQGYFCWEADMIVCWMHFWTVYPVVTCGFLGSWCKWGQLCSSMALAHNVGMWAVPADGKAKASCRILALCANSIFHATLLALQLFLSNLQRGDLVFWTCKRSGMCSGPPSCAVFVKLSLDTWQTGKTKKRQQHGACADSVNRNLSSADKVHSLQWKVIRISGIFGILSLLSAQYQANKKKNPPW